MAPGGARSDGHCIDRLAGAPMVINWDEVWIVVYVWALIILLMGPGGPRQRW